MKPRRAVRKFTLLRGEKRHAKKVKTLPPRKQAARWFSRAYRNSPAVVSPSLIPERKGGE